MVTRAKKRLVLSARSTDDDGEPVAISPFFEVAGDSFRDTDSEDSMPPVTYRSLSQAPTVDAGAGAREKCRAAALHGERDGARLVGAANRAIGRVPHIDDEGLLESLSQRDVFSASEIEAYLQCPYGWFHSYAVRPRELEREFGAAEEGSYAHELLRRAYEALRDAGEMRVTPAELDRALHTLRQVGAVLDKESGPAPDISQRLSRTRAMRWAESTIKQDAEMFDGFRPEYLEWEFGTEGGVDLGSFRLRGRVDRVDVDDRGRAIVMDYKRSAVPKAADILEAGKVQVPLYFKAVEAILGLEPVAGLYRSLSKRTVRGLVRSGELLRQASPAPTARAPRSSPRSSRAGWRCRLKRWRECARAISCASPASPRAAPTAAPRCSAGGAGDSADDRRPAKGDRVRRRGTLRSARARARARPRCWPTVSHKRCGPRPSRGGIQPLWTGFSPSPSPTRRPVRSPSG